jgi:uncharacterized protein YcbX
MDGRPFALIKPMVRIARLSVTPVKGTGLHHPESIDLGPQGAAENRLFYLIDRHGRMVNGKRAGRLVQLRCEYDPAEETLEVLTDGEAAEGARTLKDTIRLTDFHVVTDFYGRPVGGTVVGGPLAELFSEQAGEPLRLVRADRPGAGVDVHPVTLVSTATLRAFRDAASGPAARWNDRFRIMMEVDGLQPFEEEGWEFRSVTVGAAAVSIVGPVPRCVVTNQNPASGTPDFDTLAALREMRGHSSRALSTPTDHLPGGGGLLLGVYATVSRPGRVRVGDLLS